VALVARAHWVDANQVFKRRRAHIRPCFLVLSIWSRPRAVSGQLSRGTGKIICWAKPHRCTSYSNAPS
jgi:hypothetical protein